MRCGGHDHKSWWRGSGQEAGAAQVGRPLPARRAFKHPAGSRPPSHARQATFNRPAFRSPACASCQQEAHFLIQEQAYLEALQAGDTASALACLRQRLAPLSLHSERLHQLAACLMGGAAGAAAAAQLVGGGWQDGPPSQGPRHAVLRRLQVRLQRRRGPACSRGPQQGPLRVPACSLCIAGASPTRVRP